MYFCGAHYRQPIEFDDERLAEAGAQCARIREAARRLVDGPQSGVVGAAARGVLRRAGQRLQHAAGAGGGVRLGPRGQSQHARTASATPICARCSTCSALANLLELDVETAPPEVLELARERGDGAGRARFRARRPPARRDRDGAAGRSATAPTGPSCSRFDERAVIVYGRNPVREAIRGPRTVTACGPPPTPGASRGWPGRRAITSGVAADEMQRICGSADTRASAPRCRRFATPPPTSCSRCPSR